MKLRYNLSELFIWMAIVAVYGAIGRALDMPVAVSIVFIGWLIATYVTQKLVTAEAALWLSMAVGIALYIPTMLLPIANNSKHAVSPVEVLVLAVIFGGGSGLVMWIASLVTTKFVGWITIRRSVV